MAFKSQLNRNYWNDSRQFFFTPKLSLEGKNLFPQISEVHTLHGNHNQPFLNILKKPIMSLYERVHMRSEKKPVCIIGMPKEVETRHIRTGNIKKTRQELLESSAKKDTFSTCPQLTKTEIELHSPSRPCLPITHPATEGAHFYVLGPGNNKEIVEKILSNRQGWYPTTTSIFHLRWEQARPKFQNISAPHRQAINHLPGHEVISDKGNLLANLKSYCEKNEEQMYRLVPASFILDFGSEQLEEQLKKFVNFFIECNNLQNDPNPERQDEKSEETKRSKMSSRRRAANIEPTVVDSPKRIGKQPLKNSAVKIIKNRGDLITVQLSKRREECKNEYKNLVNILKPVYNFQDMSAPRKENQWVTPDPLYVYGESSLWLLKPSDLNRGRGIKLFRTIDELGEQLKVELTKHEKGSFIVQKYLERPLLLGRRKFDIRVWVLVTQQREIFLFRDGYLRLSSQNFTLDSTSMFTHLTNNAVQKHASNYGQFEQGNILPLNYLFEQGHLERNWLFGQIKRGIMLAMRAAGSKLYEPTDKHQSISIGNESGVKQVQSKIKYFELFGYDFMVDESKHVWLIEVNTNPCLELSCKHLSMLIPRMVDDAFKLTVDRMFAKKKAVRQAIYYPVEGYQDDFNMWELLQSDACQNVSTLA